MDELTFFFGAALIFLLPIIISIVAFNKAKSSNTLTTQLREQLERLKTDHTLLRMEFEKQQTGDNNIPIPTPYKVEDEASCDLENNAENYVISDAQAITAPEMEGTISLASESIPRRNSNYTAKFTRLLYRVKQALPDPITQFIDKISPIALVGLSIVFVGLSFLIKLTYEAFSVPLELKLLAVAIAGICCVGLGWRLRNKPNHFGVILQGGGMALLYLVSIAAGRYFSLLSIELTFVLVTVLVVITTLLALLQNTQIMAVVAAVAGFAVPVLLSTSTAGNHLILLGYYLLLNVGLVFLAYKKRWYFLEKSGVVCTFVLIEAWLVFSYQPILMLETLPFLASYFVLYFLLAHSHAGEEFSSNKQIISNSLVFTLPLTSYALFYTATESIAMYTAYSSLFLFLCYASAAVITFKYQRNDQLVSVYKSFALLFLAMAIPVFVSASSTAIIYALKAATILWLSNQQNRDKFALVGLGFLVASLYQLYQWQESILFQPLTIWSWVIQVVLVAFVLVFYASDWKFSYKTRWLTVTNTVVSIISMVTVVLVTGICWWWVISTESSYLLSIQLLFVGILLFCSHRFSRPMLCWSTLLLPLIMALYFYSSQLNHLVVSGIAIIVSVILLYKTTFPMYSKTLSLCTMACFNVLLGVLVITASNRATWHVSTDLVLAIYLLAALSICFFLYRATRWLPISQLFWLSPLWITLLAAFVVAPETHLEWAERGGVVVGVFALLYAFIKYDIYAAITDLIHHKIAAKRVVYGSHAIHFCGLALCCFIYIYQVFDLNIEEGVLLLPWFSTAFISVCYVPKLKNKWPLKQYLPLYQQAIVLPMVAIIASFILYSLPIFNVRIANVMWLPILNAIELTAIATVIIVAVWLRNKNTQIAINRYIPNRYSVNVQIATWCAVTGVIFAHCALARAVSDYTPTSYTLPSLWQSGIFQAGIAILWSMLAMVATSAGSRLKIVSLWWLGTLMFGLTVVKMLIIDLSNRDTIVMVFAVIFVGVVMVLVGYFSPMPKRIKSCS
ncbi:DUF2339 domain-containing protein [Vibrio sp. DW001]|uniref:DUF2339 domain-containing protein n=1 Tax=Vibrio sp. DW001 TaxID=2912315 RepID=UPI0023AE7CEE|nr:DUF2339 domain-containing protein [Vibrio sp. DW001]WED25367.1 DUF2339 domain-containing protein [Vibrio sp. DW001]